MSSIAIVTGGSSGIGLEITRTLVQSGIRCVVLARDEKKWSGIGDAVLHKGAELVTCDMAEITSVDSAFDLVSGMGRVKYLVNCAGINTRTPSIDLGLDDWDRILRVNLTAPFHLSRRVAAHVAEHGAGGSIVNIGSMASVLGIPNVAAYTAAKSALLQLTRSLAVEWAPLGIRVNAVNPGYVETSLTREVLAEGPLRNYLDNRIPVKRLTSRDEVADAVAFLLSDAARNITGQALNVDGGITAGEPGLVPQ